MRDPPLQVIGEGVAEGVGLRRGSATRIEALLVEVGLELLAGLLLAEKVLVRLLEPCKSGGVLGLELRDLLGGEALRGENLLDRTVDLFQDPGSV